MESQQADESHSKLGFKVVDLKPKAGGRSVKGSSIPLILPNDLKYNASTGGVDRVQGAQRKTLYVVPEALELLEEIVEPVSVISICGPHRTGKSYILSRLLGTADAFGLGHRMDPQTFGIWMGTKVLRGKDFTIVLLDTEGIDAAGGSADQDASILVLTILLSSQFIYNSLNVPYKGDLEKMQCFIKLAKGITVKKGERTQTSAFREFFPDFLWLLRDVSLMITDQDGIEIDPTEYLKTRVLGRWGEDDFDVSTSDIVGRAILTFFPSVECAKLERPSGDTDVMRNIAQHTDSLNPEFNKGVSELTERLLLKSRAKSGYDKGSTVSGVALSIMVKQYVEAVNDPNAIPALDNTWKNTVELLRDRAIKEVVAEYNQQMQVQLAIATNNGQDPLEESLENPNPMTWGHWRRSAARSLASGHGRLTTRYPSQPTIMDLHNELLSKVTDMLREKISHFGIGPGERSDENRHLIDHMQKRLVQGQERTVEYVAEDGTSRIQKGFVVTGGELFQYIQQNKEHSKIFCQKLFERLLDPIREHVESPPAGYNFQQLMKELALQQYHEQARGPEKWTVLQEMSQNIEELRTNFEKIDGYQRKILKEQEKTHEAELKARELAREKQELLKQAQEMQRTQHENLQKMYRLHKEQMEKLRLEMEEQHTIALQNKEELQAAEAHRKRESSEFQGTIKRMEKQMADMQRQLEELKMRPPPPPPPSNFHQTVASILSQLDDTDVQLLMRVWSARTGKQESPGAGVSAYWMKGTMKRDYMYTTAGDLRVLEKDMIAAGISFPAAVRGIPGVPDEMKFQRTVEAAVGPMGGELEIPGFVKLLVPPGVLQQTTMITISTVDVAAILRDLESVNWISGYPWTLGEDACPRELLEQVLFSPAIDVNLQGAQLNGPVEVQTWRPPGSEGMRCVLLQHHDGEGWTDVTASTTLQVSQDKVSIFFSTFSTEIILWVSVPIAIAAVGMMRRALSSRTVDCRFAAYINASPEDVQLHVVCRDKSVKTEQYLPGFTKCGQNAAMFALFHGNVLDIAVSVREGQADSDEMELQVKQCLDKYGQNVQMLLDRPNGGRVKGKVTVKKVQVLSNRTACQFIFKEEGDTLQREDIITPTTTACSRKRTSSNPLPATVPVKNRRGPVSQRRDDGAGPSGVGRDTQPTADMEVYFEKVIARVSHKWDDLARELEFSRDDIKGLQSSEPDNNHKCREVLHRWRNSKGSEATLEVLKQALIKIGERQTAEDL